MIDDLSFLATLEESYETITWSPETVVLEDQSVSELTQQEFISIAEIVAQRPQWFRRFRLFIPAQSQYESEEKIIYFQNGLKFDDGGVIELLTEADEETAEWTGEISSEFAEEEYAEAVSKIFTAFGISHIEEIQLSVTIKKQSIVDDIVEDAEIDATDSSLQLWTSRGTLESWVARTPTEQLIDTLFSNQSNPYHIFIDNADCRESKHMGFIEVESLLTNDANICSLESSRNSYENEYDALSELFTDTEFQKPAISPQVFDTKIGREVYCSVFLYAAFSCFAKTYNIDGNEFEAEIKTRRHITGSELDLKSRDLKQGQLNRLYELTDAVIHSDESSSISHWQQAVATYCKCFTQIPDKKKDIHHYYGFLREEYAKEELDKLQNTVEEVFELTRTIAESLAEASQSLTSDLQKVVITLLGAIVTNFVLILRYSDFYILFPFSTAAIAGILIFYFPMIQNSIDETQSMMKNRASDFDLYISEIRSHVGSRVFDLGKIEKQRKEHIRSARNSLDTAKTVTSKVYHLMAIVWLFVVFYAYILTSSPPPIITTKFAEIGFQTSLNQGQETIRITRSLSAIPAAWIFIKLVLHHGSFDSNNSGETTNSSTESDSKTTGELKQQEQKRVFENLSPNHYFDYMPIILGLILISIITVSIL